MRTTCCEQHASVNSWDATHYIYVVDAHGGLTDRGPHSLADALGASFDDENY